MLASISSQHAESDSCPQGNPLRFRQVEIRSRLCDFGLARNLALAGGARARDCTYRSHAAPEFAAAGNIDRLFDVYATGITLFRLVNQIHDWHGTATSLQDWERLRDQGKLLSKIGYRDEVPTSLRRIINKSCHPDPASRFSSCSEFRRALETLHFERNWVKIDDDRWISELPAQPTYEVAITARNSRFLLSSKRNGRRIAEDTAFDNLRDANSALLKYLKENTL
jgi:serine/threonine protein kinase